EAEYNTRLVALTLGEPVETVLPRPAVDPAARGRVDALLADLGIPRDHPPLIIHPGSGGSSRDWPAERFGRAARHLAERRGLRVVVTGIASETAACDAALGACPRALSLCGALTLEEMMALLARAALLIANSTGVLHLAAALGTPVVGLYPNSPSVGPRRWRPYVDRAAVVTPPDGSDVMERIEVERVVEAAAGLIETRCAPP
ncbi:MAG: glycosyltransferase family 9 protein, partial [Gemmatimonadota bacterium]